MAKRFFLWLAAVCILLCGGCSDLPDVSDPISTPEPPAVSDVPVGVQTLTLPYSHDDTLNPYAAVTEVNLNLASLLYDSLTVLDATQKPQLSLAAEVAVADATHLVVTLRQDAVFSDGSAVTATDVERSFQQAKNSANYKTLLANVSAAKGNDKKRQITFTLAAADPNGAACLTFPVIKASTLTDKAGEVPMGGGLYVAAGDRLTANPHAAVTPGFTTVSLRHLPNAATWYHALSNSEISYYFDDLSEGDLPRVTGASRPIPMNDLVFIGANGYSGKLADPTVRRALSLLLDRTAVTKTAYADYATPALQPWRVTAETQSAYGQDLDGAIALLDEAGCKPKNGRRLELELIYCTDRADRGRVAEQVRTQFESGGVTVTLVPLEEAEYRRRLADGKFDLYLGEIRLTVDNSLRPLLMGGDASYGINGGGAAALAYRQYLSGAVTESDFLSAFGADMPYIPICWRSGVAAFDRRLTAVTPTGFDTYFGFAEWE